MKKFLFVLLSICLFLLSSCSKEGFTVDAFVGHYNLEGTMTRNKTSETVRGTMDVFPTGKETFTCVIEFPPFLTGLTFDGTIEDGIMKFNSNKTIDLSSSATMTDGNSESAKLTIRLDQSVGTKHEISTIRVTAIKKSI